MGLRVKPATYIEMTVMMTMTQQKTNKTQQPQQKTHPAQNPTIILVKFTSLFA